jgi:hypothetical protein
MILIIDCNILIIPPAPQLLNLLFSSRFLRNLAPFKLYLRFIINLSIIFIKLLLFKDFIFLFKDFIFLFKALLFHFIILIQQFSFFLDFTIDLFILSNFNFFFLILFISFEVFIQLFIFGIFKHFLLNFPGHPKDFYVDSYEPSRWYFS